MLKLGKGVRHTGPDIRAQARMITISKVTCFIFQRAQDVIRWGWSQLPREADQQAIGSVAL
jgi:hypothetical protein